MINITDNFIAPEKCLEFYNYCVSAPYYYGETDNADTPPTGMVSELREDNEWFIYFSNTIAEKFDIQTFPNRMYINLFLPQEKPYFHIDSPNGKTFLFYPNPFWDITYGGETSFLIDNEIKGVLPIPNRGILFDGNILHTANSFRNKPRYTLASKYH